jgi:hypothetical protein
MELVIQLLRNYEGKGHKVVMDNYYTSQKLFRELKNRVIGSLGTIRHNRVTSITIIKRPDSPSKISYQSISSKSTINRIMPIISTNPQIASSYIFKAQRTKKLLFYLHTSTTPSMRTINGTSPKMSSTQQTQISHTWCISTTSTAEESTEEMHLSQTTGQNLSEKNGGRAYSTVFSKHASSTAI